MPMRNDTMSVNDVIVIETAASDNIKAILSGTASLTDVRRHAANITNESSIPIPCGMRNCLKKKLYENIVF